MTAFDPRDLLKTLTPGQIMALIDVLTVHDPLVDANVAAKYLGVTPQTLANWNNAGIGPPVIRVPDATGTRHLRRWRVSVLHAWALTFESRPKRHAPCRSPAGRRSKGAHYTPVETVMLNWKD